MQIEIMHTSRSLSGGRWYVGRVDPYRFEALVFAEPSRHDIGGGQVSKLCVLDAPRREGGRELAAYERQWELRPEEAAKALGVDWRAVQEAVRTVVAETSRRERGRSTD